MGPKHPCMFLLGTSEMQGSNHFLSGPVLKAMFTVSKLEELCNLSPNKMQAFLQAAIKWWVPWLFLQYSSPVLYNPLHVQKPMRLTYVISMGLGGHGNQHQYHAHAACCAFSNKVFCF